MRGGQWNTFVQMHLNAASYAHGNPNFLIWHRGYIREVERVLRDGGRRVCLHYWMWEMDSQAPHLASIWNGQEYGTQTGCQTAYLGGWQPSIPNVHCLTRNLDGNQVFATPEQINFLISRSGSYAALSQALEVPHGTVHNTIGGDMLVMTSCNDPLFFLHHANVDYQYYRWQRLNPQRANSFSGNDREKMLYIPYAPRDMYDIRSLCYTYAEFTGVTVSSKKIHYCPVDIPVYNSNSTVLPDNFTRNATSNDSAVLPDSLNRSPAPGVLPDNLNRGPAPAPGPGVLPDNQSRGPGVGPGAGPGPGPAAAPTISFTLPPVPAPQDKPAEVAPTNLDRNIPEVVVKPLPDKATRIPEGEYIAKLKNPAPLPESWCLMNNMNVTLVREIEAQCYNVHDQLHKLYGYVSPASLYLRRDLHARTIYRRDKGQVPDAQKKTCAIQVDTIGSVYVKYTENDPGKAHQEVTDCLRKVLPKHYVKPEAMRAKIQAIVGDDTAVSQESVNNVFVTSKDGASGLASTDSSAAANAVGKGMIAVTVLLMSSLLILIS